MRPRISMRFAQLSTGSKRPRICMGFAELSTGAKRARPLVGRCASIKTLFANSDKWQKVVCCGGFTHPSAISRKSRAMKQYDVVVVGGGIHGAGVLQAAAAAGHSTLLIELLGLATATSTRSSKLINAGLRYAESGQFRLAR